MGVVGKNSANSRSAVNNFFRLVNVEKSLNVSFKQAIAFKKNNVSRPREMPHARGS
jgi:hypothetical protein